MELRELKRYVLFDNGDIEPSHSGEGRDFDSLRPFYVEKDKVLIKRTVVRGYNVSEAISEVIETSDSYTALEKAREEFYDGIPDSRFNKPR